MTFIKHFLITTLIITITYISLIEFVNPQGTGLLSSSLFKNHHVNLELAKFEALHNKKFESLIIGSSTSEAFLPADLNSLLKEKSYAISLGGATTSARLAMIKKVLENKAQLSKIYYIADFFEFNKTQTKASLLLNNVMGPYFDQKEMTLKSYLTHYFNHQLLEDALRVIKRKRKNKRIIVNIDGTANRSMIMSPLKGGLLDENISSNDYKTLQEKILENTHTYQTKVLKDFTFLSPQTLSYYKELIKITKDKEIELIFILSPYHADFKKKLFESPLLKSNYQKWIEQLKNYAKKSSHVRSIDGTTLPFATSKSSNVWRDGLHYNRQAAFSIIQKLNKE